MFAPAETQMAVEGGSCAHHVSYRPSAPIHLHLLLHLLVLTSFGRNENPPSSAFAFFLLAYSRLHQLNPAPHFFLFRPFFFPATLAFSHLQTALVPGQIPSIGVQVTRFPPRRFYLHCSILFWPLQLAFPALRFVSKCLNTSNRRGY